MTPGRSRRSGASGYGRSKQTSKPPDDRDERPRTPSMTRGRSRGSGASGGSERSKQTSKPPGNRDDVSRTPLDSPNTSPLFSFQRRRPHWLDRALPPTQSQLAEEDAEERAEEDAEERAEEEDAEERAEEEFPEEFLDPDTKGLNKTTLLNPRSSNGPEAIMETAAVRQVKYIADQLEEYGANLGRLRKANALIPPLPYSEKRFRQLIFGIEQYAAKLGQP
ncbi:hypothetical protein RRF57_013266 [Xylaria bambusicola]|uniref:Uncharacterized protein n=1 Tax=Xylaria bambusicola TaxID=326684 RepID=A0AAN7ZE69_9PEZI